MYQFFFIRKSKSNPKMGTIYKAVYDDRTPISRDTLKITIPLKLWDKKNKRLDLIWRSTMKNIIIS